MKRVLLICPPTTISRGERKRVYFPVGVASLAAVLLREGYEVSMLDATMAGYAQQVEVEDGSIRYGLPFEAIVKAMTALRPDVVGVSVFCSTQAANAHEICRLARQAVPGAMTVLGGAYPTAEPETCLADSNVNFAVLGEGERAIVDLLRDPKRFADRRVRARFVEDLDTLPWPARDLVDFVSYSNAPAHVFSKRKPFAAMFTSRGCPFNCSFCFSWQILGKGFRPRSARNVLDEIEMLVQRYGVRELHFWDDNLTFDRRRAMELFQGMIDRKVNLTWSTPSGLSVAKLDRELLLKMKESGCYGLIIAPESGSQRVLSKIMRKPITLAQTESVVRTLAELDMEVGSYWMLGLPGETREEMQATVDFATRLKEINPKFYSSFSIYTPFKGTALYQLCVDKGYIKSDDLSRMKYCSGSIDTEDFTHEWVTDLRFKGWLKANHATCQEEVKSPWVQEETT